MNHFPVSPANRRNARRMRRLRFWNDDVLRDIDDVCLHIVTVAGLAAPPIHAEERLR